MGNIKSWYKGLSQREQKLVVIATIVVIAGIFYFAIWSPLNSAIAQQQKSVESDRQLLTWVQEQSNRATILRQSSNRQAFTGSLTQVVNQTTRSANIPVARLQPQGEELVVTIDEVEFNRFLTWLSTLEGRGIIIIQSDVSEVDEQGFVQVRRLILGK